MGFELDIPTQEKRPARKAKLTSQEIIAKLEETGISFTPEGLGPWSHSKLKVLRSCPLKFYLQYIIKQEPQEKPPISVITETGKAAHRILELYVGGKSLEQAYATTRAEFKNTLTDEQWVENIESIEYNVMKFKQRVDDFEASHGVKRILQELRIGVTKDWEPTGFFADDVFFRGVIDLAIQLKDDNVILIDHKYGTSQVQGMRNFNEQLDTYRVLFHAGISPTKGSQVAIHHIKEGEVSMGESKFTEDTHQDLRNKIEFFIQSAIDRVLEIGYFKHIAGSACKYCDYARECKSGQLKEQEKATAKWFENRKD